MILPYVEGLQKPGHTCNDQSAATQTRSGECLAPQPRETEMLISMRQITVAKAEAQLSTLLDAVATGEPVLITRWKKPLRDLLPQPHRPSSGVGTVQALRDAING